MFTRYTKSRKKGASIGSMVRYHPKKIKQWYATFLYGRRWIWETIDSVEHQREGYEYTVTQEVFKPVMFKLGGGGEKNIIKRKREDRGR